MKKRKKITSITDEELVKTIDLISKETNSHDMLRYTNDEIIPTSTNVYEVARILVQVDINKIERLTEQERELIKYFTSELESKQKFLTFMELVEIMGIHHSTLSVIFTHIYNKLSPENEYELRTDGVIKIMSKETVQLKLLKLIKANPEYMQLDFLTDTQKTYLAMYFKFKKDGVYPSYPLLAKAIDETEYKIQDTMEIIYNKIHKYHLKKGNVFIDHKGYILGKDSGRIRLLKFYTKPQYRKLLKQDEILILDLFMQRNGKTFVYSPGTIADMIGNPGEKGITSVNNYVSKFLRMIGVFNGNYEV